jgi:hypothetical protein
MMAESNKCAFWDLKPLMLPLLSYLFLGDHDATSFEESSTRCPNNISVPSPIPQIALKSKTILFFLRTKHGSKISSS